MKCCILISFFFLSFYTFSQANPHSSLFPSSIDSIILSIEKNQTKEMVLPNQSEIHELIGEVTLNQKDAITIRKLIQKKSSYRKGRTLLTHHNLVFSFYSGKILQLKTQISTLTSNIDIYAKEKKPFHGRISTRMEKYLANLLKRLGFYETIKIIGD